MHGGDSGGEKVLRPAARDHSFASLDLMRGMAALIVLFQHTDSAISSGPVYFPTLGLGSFAVDVFMLISGFLMMWHYYERGALGERWSDPQTIFRFYLRRFFRIAPLYYLLLIVSYTFSSQLNLYWDLNAAHLHQPVQTSPYDSTVREATIGHILSHLTFTFGFFPCYAESTNMPDWSIGLEMQFYLFFPLLAIFLVRSGFIGALIVLLPLELITWHLFAVGLNSTPKALGWFPATTLLPFSLDQFLIGMLLAAGLYNRDGLLRSGFLFLLALFLAGLYMKKFLAVCFLFLVYEISTSQGTDLKFIDFLAGKVKVFVNLSLFKFMANTSYGVYLLHIMLLIVLVKMLSVQPWFLSLGHFLRLVVTLGLIIPSVYSLAFLLFRLIEAPGILLGRKLLKRVT